MPVNRAQIQVTWAAANTKTVNSPIEVVSDVYTIDTSCVALTISLSADNQGTPALGDTAVFRIQWSTGDLLADGGDDYDTSEHAMYLTTLDTYGANTPGEDPARRTVPVPLSASKFKLAVVCANAATRNMLISARVEEQRLT